ncbi:MAG: thiamine phosphate synthase [Caulobacterales bacterium]
MTSTPACRLYAITPPALPDLPAFERALIEALDAGDVACLQLRLKDLPDEDILKAGQRLAPIAQERGVAFIVNDRPDLALALGADGVHIGQEDANYKQARQIMGLDRIVGVTCHDSPHLAMVAGEAGADYVAFGAFFPTATKAPKATANPDILRWWQEIFEIPCVAIGGITIQNAPALIQAGADFLAVSAGIWAHPDGPAAAVKQFNALLSTVERA